MGNTCSINESYEDCLRKLFSNIPIKQNSPFKINDIINEKSTQELELNTDKIYFNRFEDNEFQKKSLDALYSKIPYIKEDNTIKTITETNYQSLVHKYLIYGEFESHLYKYFMEIYKEIPYNLKYPVVKLVLILLSKSENKTFAISLYEDLFYYLEVYQLRNTNALTSGKMVKEISNKTLLDFLDFYVGIISSVTISFLAKPLLRNNYSSSLEEKYKKLWSQRNVNSFVRSYFFKDDLKLVNSRVIDLFLKEYLHDLIDTDSLRLKLTEYAEKQETLHKDAEWKKEENMKLVF